MGYKIPTPGPQAVSCAKCCSVWATSGVIFLFWVGSLLNSQPLYVIGVDKPEVAAKQCFGAAWIYIAVVVISICVLAADKMHARDRLATGNRGGRTEYGAISFKNEQL